MIYSQTMNNSPMRQIKARVELFSGSTLVDTFSYVDRLVSFDVERVGENKFFGFGFCQRLNVKLRDVQRELDITTAHSLKIYLDSGSGYICTLPLFYVSEVHRDENTNQLSVTAYDAIKKAGEMDLNQINFITPLAEEEESGKVRYSIIDFTYFCADTIGASGLQLINVQEDELCFSLTYENGANYEGTETIRQALDDIAEATQTIYYMNYENILVFKRLNANSEPCIKIEKEDYFTLDSKTNRRLVAVCHATELGDNVISSLEISGTTQYVRDNAFWELREDIDVIVDAALAAVGGLTINQFDCSWRGNFLLEIGDKIALETKDGLEVVSYILNDKILYDGSYSQKTQWVCDDNAEESAANPTSLGETLKLTYARVDKINKEIDLVASEASSNASKIAAIQVNTDSINQTVKEIKEVQDSSLEEINGELATLTKEVSTKVSADEVEFLIKQSLKDGVDGAVSEVITTTGFKFDETGLIVSKSDSEVSTIITQDGMIVKKGNKEVLRADNEGVKAIDLHAETYLIIGKYSRFEDYPGKQRTACFWIGG